MNEFLVREELGGGDDVTFDLDKDPAVMSREDLVQELRFRRGLEQIHPNSYASLYLMDGRETHKHMFKVMNPFQMAALIIPISMFVIGGLVVLKVSMS